MAAASSDLNLLFGMLALQLDFITKDQLLSAMQAWILDKSKPLSKILVNQGVLAADKQQLLNALVKKHLEVHNNDPQQSMASLEVRVFARDALKQVKDADVHASLVRIKELRPTRQEPPPRNEQYNTVAPSSAPDGKAAASRFRILRPHAKGGLGVVFVARDEEIGREVALKEIQIQLARDADSRARFVLEAEITGGLEHPGIVPVYGLGHYADGRPYYAMRFIRGDSLKEAADHFHAAEIPGRDPMERSLALKELLRRFTDVCNAIEYAHSKGVLHRDLKPGNIMLGKYGETLVVDWGLAKAQVKSDSQASLDLNETPLMPSSIGDSSHTQMGSAIGTPAFMSPEQAAGRLDLLGPASDVYSLGATLYYILTGQTSVMSPELAEVLRCVQKGDITPPREVNPLIDRPLDAICMKAMARDPLDRYASAADLKSDIDRWLDDSPVTAWREPLITKIRRWFNHHRGLATATLVGIAVATISLGGATLLLTKVNHDLDAAKLLADENARQATINEELAVKNEKKANENAVIAKKNEDRANANAIKAEKNRQETLKANAKLKKQENEAQWKLYAANIRLAQTAWLDSDVPNAFTYLKKCHDDHLDDRRGWEHSYLNLLWTKGQSTLKGHGKTVTGVAFAAGGQHVISCSSENTLRIWDPATGREVFRFKTAHVHPITCVAVSADGRRAASGGEDYVVKIWDTKTGDEIQTLKGHKGFVVTVAISGDGERVVSGSADRTVRVWDVKSGREIFLFDGHKNKVISVAVSQDGERVVSGCENKQLKAWDARDGQNHIDLKGHTGAVLGLAFSKDGQRIVSGADDASIKLWDAKTGADLLTLRGHKDFVASVAISADGNRIASAGDKTIKLWDVKTGQETHTLRGHADLVKCVAMSADGERLVSGSVDQTVKIWNPSLANLDTMLNGHTADVNCLAFSRDGQRIVSGSHDNTAKVWEAKSGRDLLTLKGHADTIFCVAISPDGQRIVTASKDKTLKIWDAKMGEAKFSLPAEVKSVVFSADGQRIIAAKGNTLQIWNATTGASIQTIKAHDEPIKGVAVSIDGRHLASASDDSTVKLWNATTGAYVRTLKGHTDGVISVAFSPDSGRIASGGADRKVKIWDSASGEPLHTLEGHTELVTCVAFGGDGKRLISGSEDATLRLWDAINGQETLLLKSVRGPVSCLAFGVDGNTERIAAGSDRTVNVMEATRTGK
jgi:WD40 repeat protein/serine/threonine protein kinase